MIQLLTATGLIPATAELAAGIAPPKGNSVGELMVTNPALCQVTEFDLPESMLEVCKRSS